MEDIDAVVARLRARGAELVGELVARSARSVPPHRDDLVEQRRKRREVPACSVLIFSVY